MAKSKEKTADDAEGLDLTELLDAESLNPALDQLLTELGGDAKERVTVYVSKLVADSGKEARIWNGPPDDYDLSALAKRFGSGDYRVKVYAPTERGNPAIRANTVITMLLDPADDARIAAQRRGEVPGNQTQGLSETRVVELIAAALKQNQPAPVNPMDMMNSVVGMVQKLIPPAAAPSASQGTGFMEVLGAATKLLEISRGFGSDRNDDERPQRGESAMMRGLTLFEKLLDQRANLNQVQQPGKTEEPQLSAEEQEQLASMRMALNMAVRSAKKGENPKEFAELAYDYVEIEMIAGLFNDTQWFDMIVGNVPEAKNYKPFFEAVRTHLITFAQEDGLLTADGKIKQTPVDGSTDAGHAAAEGNGASK